MASPSLLHSSASSFHCRFPSLAIPTSAPPPPQRNLLKVSASGTVLVEKSESEKVQRLKSAYLERIIPALKDEFKYINIHQVTSPKSLTPIHVILVSFFWGMWSFRFKICLKNISLLFGIVLWIDCFCCLGHILVCLSGSKGTEDCGELWNRRCSAERQRIGGSNERHSAYNRAEACQDKS